MNADRLSLELDLKMGKSSHPRQKVQKSTAGNLKKKKKNNFLARKKKYLALYSPDDLDHTHDIGSVGVAELVRSKQTSSHAGELDVTSRL